MMNNTDCANKISARLSQPSKIARVGLVRMVIRALLNSITRTDSGGAIKAAYHCGALRPAL